MTRFEFYAKAVGITIFSAFVIYFAKDKEAMLSSFHFMMGTLWGLILWRNIEVFPGSSRLVKNLSTTKPNAKVDRAGDKS